MRVTKNIREFIEKEVRARIAPKYEADRVEAARQTKIDHEIWEEVLQAMKEAADKVLEKAFAEHEFLEDLREENHRYVELRKAYSYTIGDARDIGSVHRYQSRMREEIEDTVKAIVVELELGGTKAELMEMLEKIG